MTQPPPNPIQRLIRAPGDFIIGSTYPLQAIVLVLRSPSLLGCITIPILLNVLLGTALYVGLLLPSWNLINQWTLGLPTETSKWVGALPNWLNRVLFWLPSGVSFVDDVLRVLLAIALFIVLGLVLVQFGAIFGAPWYGNLAEQVERSRLGKLPTPATMTLKRATEDIRRAIDFQLKKLLLFVALGVPLLAFNIVPIAGNLIASIGGITLAATLVCLDFLDPPLERRRLSFRSKLAIAGATLPASASFGIISLWLVSIPLLNLLTVPLCIIAGTLFCCDYALPKLETEGKDES
jgi:CysZ protein